MAKGISIQSDIRMSVYHASRDAKGRYRHPPGRPVGVIVVAPKDYKKGDFCHLELTFVVNPYRKDFKKVFWQGKRKGKLSSYQQSLYESCFKNW